MPITKSQIEQAQLDDAAKHSAPLAAIMELLSRNPEEGYTTAEITEYLKPHSPPLSGELGTIAYLMILGLQSKVDHKTHKGVIYYFKK